MFRCSRVATVGGGLGLDDSGAVELTPYLRDLYTTQWWTVLSAFPRSDQESTVKRESGDSFRR